VLDAWAGKKTEMVQDNREAGGPVQVKWKSRPTSGVLKAREMNVMNGL
jgi:hypothetical protein